MNKKAIRKDAMEEERHREEQEQEGSDDGYSPDAPHDDHHDEDQHHHHHHHQDWNEQDRELEQGKVEGGQMGALRERSNGFSAQPPPLQGGGVNGAGVGIYPLSASAALNLPVHGPRANLKAKGSPPSPGHWQRGPGDGQSSP
eukprot:2498553-Rhodomonas_salina.1